MAGGIGTGYGALDFLMAGGGATQPFGINPYSPAPTSIMGLPANLVGGTGANYGSMVYAPGYGYSTTVQTGTNAGSGYLASDQIHTSSQDARAVYDGQTTNNLFSQQRDLQKVNVFLDPQIGPGRSGTNMPIGGFLSDLVTIGSDGQVADTEVKNNQQIGLDQSAYAEEGGTAINNAYQIQNNVQIVNLYLDLNIQLPGMPQNPWMPSPWLPGGGVPFPNYPAPQGVSQYPVYGAPGSTRYNPAYGTGYYAPDAYGSPYPTGAPQYTQPAPQYDPDHVLPYKDFVDATTDLDYASRSQLRNTIEDYARFFDNNGAPRLSRAFMTLAGAVGSGVNLDRAERRFLRFEDAVLALDDTEKAYLYDALNVLAEEVPQAVNADPDLVLDIQYSLQDLGRAITGYDYEDLGYDNTGTDTTGDTGSVDGAGAAA